MSLPGICPGCGAQFPLEAALADAEARTALAAALALPAPLARLVVPYLALHAPAGKRIAWRKLSRLIAELTGLVTAGQVQRRGVAHGAPQALWAQGLEAVLAARDAGTLALPLDGHAYLTEIVWREAARAAGRTERAAEEAKRSTGAREGSGGLKPAGKAVDRAVDKAAAAAHLNRLKRAVKGRTDAD